MKIQLLSLQSSEVFQLSFSISIIVDFYLSATTKSSEGKMTGGSLSGDNSTPYPSCLSPALSIANLKYVLRLHLLFSQDAFSTLDLVSGDDVEFLLIIAPIKESYRLALAAFKVAEEFKVPLKVCVMWQGKAIDGISSSKTSLSPWKNFIDVIEAESSAAPVSWWDLCQMTDRGAVLVRPDEHIAWRAKSEIKNDPILVFKKVFCAVLGLEFSST